MNPFILLATHPLVLALHNSSGWHPTLNLSFQPILALVAGLIILVRPRFLNFVVALYLIIIGIIGLLGV